MEDQDKLLQLKNTDDKFVDRLHYNWYVKTNYL